MRSRVIEAQLLLPAVVVNKNRFHALAAAIVVFAADDGAGRRPTAALFAE
jgi:hypothetical protein